MKASVDLFTFKLGEGESQRVYSYPIKEVRLLASALGMDIEVDRELLWFLKQALVTILPRGWEKERDPMGATQYHNADTGMTTEMHPLLFVFRAAFRHLIEMPSQANSVSPSATKPPTRTESTDFGSLLPTGFSLQSPPDHEALFTSLLKKVEKQQSRDTEMQSAAMHEVDLFYSNLITGPKVPESVSASFTYQTIDPRRMLGVARALGIADDYRLMWIARMFLAAPLPPLWKSTSDAFRNEVFVNSHYGIAMSTHPGTNFFYKYVKKLRFGGIADQPTTMVFLNSEYREFEVDLQRLMSGQDFVLRVSEEPVSNWQRRMKLFHSKSSVQEKLSEVMKMEITESCGLQWGEDEHLLGIVYEHFAEKKQAGSLSGWEFRYTLEGQQYWYHPGTQQASKSYPFKSDLRSAIDTARITMLQRFGQVMKQPGELHRVFAGKTANFVSEVRAEVASLMHNFVFDYLEALPIEVQSLKSLLSLLDFRPLTRAEIEPILFACPFSISDTQRNVWKQHKTQVETAADDEIAAAFEQEDVKDILEEIKKEIEKTEAPVASSRKKTIAPLFSKSARPRASIQHSQPLEGNSVPASFLTVKGANSTELHPPSTKPRKMTIIQHGKPTNIPINQASEEKVTLMEALSLPVGDSEHEKEAEVDAEKRSDSKAKRRRVTMKVSQEDALPLPPRAKTRLSAHEADKTQFTEAAKSLRERDKGAVSEVEKEKTAVEPQREETAAEPQKEETAAEPQKEMEGIAEESLQAEGEKLDTEESLPIVVIEPPEEVPPQPIPVPVTLPAVEPTPIAPPPHIAETPPPTAIISIEKTVASNAAPIPAHEESETKVEDAVGQRSEEERVTEEEKTLVLVVTPPPVETQEVPPQKQESAEQEPAIPPVVIVKPTTPPVCDVSLPRLPCPLPPSPSVAVQEPLPDQPTIPAPVIISRDNSTPDPIQRREEVTFPLPSRFPAISSPTPPPIVSISCEATSKLADSPPVATPPLQTRAEAIVEPKKEPIKVDSQVKATIAGCHLGLFASKTFLKKKEDESSEIRNALKSLLAESNHPRSESQEGGSALEKNPILAILKDERTKRLLEPGDSSEELETSTEVVWTNLLKSISQTTSAPAVESTAGKFSLESLAEKLKHAPMIQPQVIPIRKNSSKCSSDAKETQHRGKQMENRPVSSEKNAQMQRLAALFNKSSDSPVKTAMQSAVGKRQGRKGPERSKKSALPPITFQLEERKCEESTQKSKRSTSCLTGRTLSTDIESFSPKPSLLPLARTFVLDVHSFRHYASEADNMEYYLAAVGHPFRPSLSCRFPPPSRLLPSYVVLMGRRLGVSASLHPFESLESDLLSVAYLSLVTPLPPAYPSLPYAAIIALPTGRHPGDSYFTLMLEYQRTVRSRELQRMDKAERVRFVVEKSWLEFQDERGERYRHNFLTGEEAMASSLALMKFSKESQSFSGISKASFRPPSNSQTLRSPSSYLPGRRLLPLQTSRASL